MQSRKDFARSQRSSNIFDEEDVNSRNSPNHGKNKSKDAYRHALQEQIESDRELRNYYKEHEDDHPLEMRVERHSIKPTRGDEEYEDGNEFFIGADERNKRGQTKASQLQYASALDEDIARMHEHPRNEDDEYSSRKPYERSVSPVEEGFFIGRDEKAEKQHKKEQAVAFYRAERQRLENCPSPTRANRRREESQEDASGFSIGRDEKESMRNQARMKVIQVFCIYNQDQSGRLIIYFWMIVCILFN